jgi:hypothetical protein
VCVCVCVCVCMRAHAPEGEINREIMSPENFEKKIVQNGRKKVIYLVILLLILGSIIIV